MFQSKYIKPINEYNFEKDATNWFNGLKPYERHNKIEPLFNELKIDTGIESKTWWNRLSALEKKKYKFRLYAEYLEKQIMTPMEIRRR